MTRRVLLVNYEFPPQGGGAGRATWHLAQGLTELGLGVEVLTSGDVASISHEHGVEVHRVAIRRRGVHKTGGLGLAQFVVRGRKALARLLAAKRFDLVHYFFSLPCGVLSLGQGRGLPAVVSLRGGDVPGYNPGEMQLAHRLLRPVNRRVWRRADALAALSRSLRDAVLAQADGLSIEVIGNGVDTALFRPPPDKTAQPDGPFRLLSVARLVQWKGLQYLLRAMGQLGGLELTLDIVGSGGYEARLKSLAAELGLGRRVRFLGAMAHESLPAIYGRADVFVLPSYGDSFGQVFSEAMACGLPIVAAKAGGVVELVEQGVSGLLVEPRNAEDLGRAIRRLHDHDDLRAEMARANLAKAREQLSWQAVTEQYLDIYQRVLDLTQA